MRLIIGLGFLASYASAAATQRSTPYLQACEDAINCEVVEDNSTIPRIAFKPGMGPGSAAFDRLVTKRDDDGTVVTQVALSDHLIEYGCSGDTDVSAMLGNLDQICKDQGSCIEKESYEQEIDWVDTCDDCMIMKSTKKWVLTGSGEYPAEYQAAFIQAVQAVGGKEVQTKMKSWAHLEPIAGFVTYGECKLFQQTEEIHISRYVWNSGEKALQGFIVAKVSVESLFDSGLCEKISGLLGSIAGAIPGIGGAIGAVFGAVTASCT